MSGILRLNIKEANDLADEIERNGGNADGLRAAINDVNNPGNGRTSIPALTATDEEWIEAKRSQSTIDRGAGLECMMCHDKFDHLICGTCEVCFREWMLPLKPRGVWKTLV